MKLRPGKKLYRGKKVNGIKAKLPWKVIRKAGRVRKRSSLELLVYGWLDKAGIRFIKEKAIGRCHVDIFIEPNIIVECQGDYYHANPEVYPEPDRKMAAKRLKDAKRFAYFRSLGYIVIELWELDTKKERAEPTRKKLIKKLKRLIKKSKVD